MRVSFPGLVILLFAVTLANSVAQQISEPVDGQPVWLVDGTQSVQMTDAAASRKGSSIFVVSKQVYVFKGPRAALRTKNPLPEFQFEKDPSLDSVIQLFRFDVRADRREIRIAKGSGGLTLISIPKDHLIETTLEPIGNGTQKRYRLKPNVSLKPGEYCLSRQLAACYDFGVD